MYWYLLYLHIRFQIRNIHTFLTFPNVSHSMRCDSSCLAAPVFCDAIQGDRFRETPSWRNAQLDSEQNCNELFLKVATVTFAIYYVFKKQFTV